MSPLEELLNFVRKVSLLRRAQRRYGTRQVGTTLAEVRKLEQEVDDLVRHFLAAPIPLAGVGLVEQLGTIDVTELPDSALPPLPDNVEPLPFVPPIHAEPVAGLEQPEQPPVTMPKSRRLRRGEVNPDAP